MVVLGPKLWVFVITLTVNHIFIQCTYLMYMYNLFKDTQKSFESDYFKVLQISINIK